MGSSPSVSSRTLDCTSCHSYNGSEQKGPEPRGRSSVISVVRAPEPISLECPHGSAMFCVHIFVLGNKLKPLHSGPCCHSMSLSAASRGPAPPNACPRAAGGRATGTPRGAGTARGPPAALPAAKRTAKGKGVLRAGSRRSRSLSPPLSRAESEGPRCAHGQELAWGPGPLLRSRGP